MAYPRNLQCAIYWATPISRTAVKKTLHRAMECEWFEGMQAFFSAIQADYIGLLLGMHGSDGTTMVPRATMGSGWKGWLLEREEDLGVERSVLHLYLTYFSYIWDSLN